MDIEQLQSQLDAARALAAQLHGQVGDLRFDNDNLQKQRDAAQRETKRAESARNEIEQRLTEAEQQLKLSRQRIATLTAVAVLAYKYRRAPIMCDEHNRLDRQLAAALEAAGIRKDTPAVTVDVETLQKANDL